MTNHLRMIAAPLLAVSMALATASNAQSVRELREQVASELQPFCRAGSTVSAADGALEFAADGTAVVRLGLFRCDWEFVNHPFCGARHCETRTYVHRDGRFEQTGAYLE